MKERLETILPWTLLALGMLISIDNKMNLIVPMAVVVYLFRKRIKVWLDRFSLPVAFIGSGLFFGLMTECFAIWNNLNLPLKERALLNPHPPVDLLLAFFWYGLFVLIWYFLLQKYPYKRMEIYALAGAYGLLFEQKGVFLGLLFSPGFIVPLFIMFVYAVFPILAYMLTEHRFPVRPEKSFLVRYSVAIGMLALHVVLWSFAGNIYYPVLQSFGLLAT